jgi:hypothetical protein
MPGGCKVTQRQPGPGRAVGPDQAVHAARRDIQFDDIEGDDLSEGLGDPGARTAAVVVVTGSSFWSRSSRTCPGKSRHCRNAELRR